ncbi:hypothetical protein E4U43_005463, partial [Claviceps pusilla]
SIEYHLLPRPRPLRMGNQKGARACAPFPASAKAVRSEEGANNSTCSNMNMETLSTSEITGSRSCLMI